MKAPCYDTRNPQNHTQVGILYSMERALCAFLLAQGSFFRNDGRSGATRLNEQLYKTIVLQNKREPDEYSTEYTRRLVKWLEVADWPTDYPSYIFLHDLLCRLLDRFHGMPARLASPHRAHSNYFVSKYLRNPDAVHQRLVNMLAIGKTIFTRIESQRFQIVETHFGYKWRHQHNKWFLDVNILFGLRGGNTRNDFRTILEKKFGSDRGMIHSISHEMGLPDIEGISILGSAPGSQKSESSGSKAQSLQSEPIAKKNEFSDSDDDDMVAQLQNKAPPIERSSESKVKSEKLSQAHSDSLFESSSTTKVDSDVRYKNYVDQCEGNPLGKDSYDKFIEEWFTQKTDSNASPGSSKKPQNLCQKGSDATPKKPANRGSARRMASAFDKTPKSVVNKSLLNNITNDIASSVKMRRSKRVASLSGTPNTKKSKEEN